MLRFLLILIISLSTIQGLYAQNTFDSLAWRYAQSITAHDLSRSLHVLASDSLEGRETGKPGQKKAAAYIASEFQSYGAMPAQNIVAKGPEAYYQPFMLERKSWDKVTLAINGNAKTYLKDFYLYGDLEFTNEQSLQMVYGGYGIDCPAYSDFGNLNVKDKAVVIYMGDPTLNGKSLITGDSSLSEWAYDWRRKAGTAMGKGAAAVFIVLGNQDEDFVNRLNRIKDHIGKPTLGFTHKKRNESAIFTSHSLGAELLGMSKSQMDAYRLYRCKLAANQKPGKRIKLNPATLTLKCPVQREPVSTENVLGVVWGSDKRDEIVVVTAHYDHLGKEGNIIHYGADDDGTGTSAIMELAQAFALAAKEGKGPRRTMLFMAVTAEEKGLMGSEYYSDRPIFPLAKTITNLNIDMIGRRDEKHKNEPNYIYIIGSNMLSTDLHEINENANTNYTRLQLDYTFNSYNDPNRFYFRSDHYNFAKYNIPVIFYFNGVHEDYHQPSDTVDKIDFQKMENITRLVFFTAWDLANREVRPRVNVVPR